MLIRIILRRFPRPAPRPKAGWWTFLQLTIKDAVMSGSDFVLSERGHYVVWR